MSTGRRLWKDEVQGCRAAGPERAQLTEQHPTPAGAATAQPTNRVIVTSPTEERNPRTINIDTVSTRELVALIQEEDARVIPAAAAVLPQMAELVDRAATAITAGGRVHYFGAGTSGRIGVLDAAELLPTYGIPDDMVIAHHAGGLPALVKAAENVEDDDAAGRQAAAQVSAADVVIGLTASGRTPYVAGALRFAHEVGATTALITSHPQPQLASLADIVLAADTGPEAITGSTRMKAGTAAKLILSGFSTALMVKLGRTYSNLMITMRPTNAKLRGRAIELLQQATGESATTCEAALGAADHEIPVALLLLLRGDASDSAAAARARADLERAGGRVRAALVL